MVSTAHEWVQMLPLSKSIVKCTICAAEAQIGHWPKSRCIEHAVNDNSGYLLEGKPSD
jgi:hypothetical protein